MLLVALLLAAPHTQEPPMPPTPADAPEEHTNALIHETSPYLLQHAHNPVDWRPWGPEALELAKQRDMPIFLSIGYSACHWCHVMEEESFEDERIAGLLNERFVCIKVDREERPDIDEIYMGAVQAMTGSGGWPLSVFLTPDLEPFYGGTYYPPTTRFGRPGFDDVVTSLARAWDEERDKIVEQAGRLRAHLEQVAAGEGADELRADLLDRSLASLRERFDPTWGGFGAAPKFPHAADLTLTLRHARRTGDASVLAMATTTLDRMAEGGIFDQLAGGFARYSTDERWLVPHFEKMLYDNALLVPVYLEAYGMTGDAHHARTARLTLDWVLAEMRTAEGGFASSLDADSEGEEGRFYVWDREELRAVLGKQLGDLVADRYGVTDDGTFEEGKSVLWRNAPAEEIAVDHGLEVAELEEALAEARPRLLAARESRPRPARDDKVLVSWNGLMITAMAQGSWVLGDERYLVAAQEAADLVLNGMRQGDGRLFATSRAGRAHLNAYLDDYAFLIAGLLDLYQADFDPRWVAEALALAAVVEEEFAAEDGGYFSTGDSHEQLLLRMRSSQDGAMPAGLGVHAQSLVRLGLLTGDPRHTARAERALASIGRLANRFPAAFGSSLAALDLARSQPRQVVLAGEPEDAGTRALLEVVRSGARPHLVVALADGRADAALMPLLEAKLPGPDGPVAYVCRDSTCEAPSPTPRALEEALAKP